MGQYGAPVFGEERFPRPIEGSEPVGCGFILPYEPILAQSRQIAITLFIGCLHWE